MNNINSRAAAARTDENVFSQLVMENRNFILSGAHKAAGYYITESDDEWSVALIAFHEAVKTFDESKGNFYSFASLVIKRRIIDFIRSDARYSSEISVSPEVLEGNVDEDSSESAIGARVKEKIADLSEDTGSQQEDTACGIRAEIEAVRKILQSYGFSFFDLAECSPKSEKTKAACARAAAALLTTPELLHRMRSKKTLPIKEISEISKVPRKVLDRHRKYIIAAAEILNGEYPLLAGYMSYIRKLLIT